ncbi:MAG: hypothetical protein WCK02_06005 [Bacteroidota bacterium]
MKFTISTIICIFFLFGCINKSEGKYKSDVIPDSLKVTIISTKNYSVEDVSAKDFDEAVKNYDAKFVYDTLKYPKTNGVIMLPISNEKYRFLKDTLEQDPEFGDYRVYKYLGHFTDINSYLVLGGFYEYLEYYLIKINSGKIDTIFGLPKISPKNKYIMTINEMGGMGDELIGFHIWKIENDRIDFIVTVDSETMGWYPVDFIWDNNGNIIIKVISTKSNDYKNYNKIKQSKDCIYKRLILK